MWLDFYSNILFGLSGKQNCRFVNNVFKLSLIESVFFSLWQNTDAALLPTISYPAFAVDDDALYTQTLDKIVRKLRGKYGFKRFLRDGYRTANEDKNRRYYKPAEMKVVLLPERGFLFHVLFFSFYLRFIIS